MKYDGEIHNLVTAYPSYIDENICDDFYRREHAVLDAIKQVQHFFPQKEVRKILHSIYSSHHIALTYWKSQIEKDGRSPQKEGEFLGLVIEAVIGGAKILGPEMALRALIKGEELLLEFYKENLKSDSKLAVDFRDKIRDNFLPEQRFHISKLKEILENHYNE